MSDDDKRVEPMMPSAEEAEQKIGTKRKPGQVPGGAEGGDSSESVDKLALPADDDAPLGDTDQHSR